MTPQNFFGIQTVKDQIPNSVTNTIEIWQSSDLTKIKGLESKFYGEMAQYSDLKCLGEVELTEEIDFLDGEYHDIKIEYDDAHLKIYIGVQNIEPIMNVKLNLSDVLNLDNGSAYVGIC